MCKTKKLEHKKKDHGSKQHKLETLKAWQVSDFKPTNLGN
jgi:hypothetical protein